MKVLNRVKLYSLNRIQRDKRPLIVVIWSLQLFSRATTRYLV